jgi:hypothetical protein
MDGGSISSGNSAAGTGNSLTNGKLKKAAKSKLHSNLLAMESGTSTMELDGDDGSREIEEQFKRQVNSPIPKENSKLII